jgi:hypothetical protein
LTAKDGQNIVEAALRGLFRHKCHQLDLDLNCRTSADVLQTVAHATNRHR